MQDLVLVKFGGSVITDKSKSSTLRLKNLKRLVLEIKNSQKKYKGKIIIGHGAGSFAHRPASKYQTKNGLNYMGSQGLSGRTLGRQFSNQELLFGMSIVEDAARRLNALVVKEFLNKKVPIFPFSPGSFLISDIKGCVKSYIDPLINALEIDVTPVVYGDVVMSIKNGFTIFSTEKVLSVLAKKLYKKYKIKIIYVTDVDGVYDKNGKTITNINLDNFGELKNVISGAKNVDVTGGMLHKVEQSLEIGKTLGIQTFIISGTRFGELEKAILGKKTSGTTIN